MSPAAGMKKETALKNMEEAVYRVIASMQKEREG
jgi:hypothetical protein